MSTRREGRQEGRSQSQRQLRVGEELRHAISAALMRGDLRDPDLEDASITVTEVRVSPDLRNATAYVMPLGGDRRDEILEALRRASPYLRGQIARAVRLKYAPQLSFAEDASFDEAARIERLLRSPAVAPDLAPTRGEESAADGDADGDVDGDEAGTARGDHGA